MIVDSPLGQSLFHVEAVADTSVGSDEVIPNHPFQRYVLHGSQRVVRIRDEHDILFPLRHTDEVRRNQFPLQGKDEVQLVLTKKIECGGQHIGCLDYHVNLRIFFVKTRENSRKNSGRKGRAGTYAKCAGRLIVFFHERRRLFHRFQQTQCIWHELFAGMGQLYTSTDSIEQLRTQLVFQLLDLYRHRRLRVPQLCRRLGKALHFRRFDKCYYITNFHKRSPYTFQNL